MGEKVQINLRVDKEQKEEWEEYLEHTREYNTISDLIRSSVEAEMKGDETQPFSESPALASDVQEMKNHLERVRKDVTWLKNQQQDEVNVSDLAQDVFDELEKLPELVTSLEIPDGVEDTEAYRRKQAAAQVLTPDSADEADEWSRSYTVEALANRFDESEERIEDAIDLLEEQFLPIVEVELPRMEEVGSPEELDESHPYDLVSEVGTETHYFKEE